MSKLLAENNVPPADSLKDLVHVQALLIYQVLYLYNGDICLRRVAESNIPVLYSWMEQMIEYARHEVSLGVSLISSYHEWEAADLRTSGHHGNLFWYSWILVECIRRTWLVASGIQGAYLVIKHRRAIPCQGGVMFTTRQEVWEAQLARSWETICSEVKVGLMQVADTARLFVEVSPANVDDFAMLILQATFGEERVEIWKNRKLS